jgi:sugar phosphate isomerase/epimerase
MEIGSCAAQVVGADLEAKMNALHAAGYDFIEPAWRGDDLPRLGTAFGQTLREMGERTGCPVRSAIYGGYSDVGARLRTDESRAHEMDVLQRACETLAAAGGDVLLLPHWAGEAASDYDDLYVAYLREGAARAAEAGVRLGIEQIPGSKYRNTMPAVYELVERVNHPGVGIYFDIANGMYIGDDPLEDARIIAPRVVQYHVKNYKQERPLEAMPLREVKALFEAEGFRGRVATEIDPIEVAPEEKTNAHLSAALRTLREHGY